MNTVKLRKVRPGDAEALSALGFSPEVLRGMGVLLAAPASMDLGTAQIWIDRIANDPHAWIIEHEGKLAGEIRLHHISTDDQRASLAVAIVDSAKLNKGIGRAAIRLCLKIAFEDMDLYRVSVRVLSSNARAIRCYEICGFRREGVERKAAKTDWGREDDIMMGILASEYH